MAERVEIMVVANDAASQVLRGITSNFGQLGSMVQSLTGGRIIEDLTGQIVKFGKDSVEATIKYANEVRSLQMISGESAEETSRFLQVLDDYKISAQDATAATRAMTKEGLVPNLETLAKLSDEYLSITDKEKQNEFVIKNLGRAGLQWVEILNKGSAAIRAQGEAVSEGLILNQKQLDQARELEIAMDSWGESIQEVQYQFGTGLIPVLTDAIDWLMAWDKAITGHGFNMKVIIQQLYDARMEQRAHKESMLESKKAEENLNAEREKTKEQLKQEEDAIRALTKANEDYLSLIGDLAGNLTDYEQKHNDIQRELDEGKITLDEAKAKWKQLADEQEKATYRMMLNMLQQRLSIDGLDDAETAFLLEQGVQWGIYSRKAVDQANTIMRNVDALVAKYRNIPSQVSTNIVANYVTSYVNQGVPSYVAQQYIPGRAAGGDVSAGMLYQVNETRKEYFKPSMNGTVMPLGGDNGSSNGFTFVYSPQISLGTQREIEETILPAVESAVRRMQSDGRAS